MTEDFEELCRDFIEETLGDGQISYIYDDFVDGAWQFAEYLKNRSSKPKANQNED